MYKTRMALFAQQGRQIIVVPLDCSFEDRPPSQRRAALNNIRKSAKLAGLDAPVAAVWKVGNKLHFLAPDDDWHAFLKTLTWNTIIANLSVALNCNERPNQALIKQPEATPDGKGPPARKERPVQRPINRQPERNA